MGRRKEPSMNLFQRIKDTMEKWNDEYIKRNTNLSRYDYRWHPNYIEKKKEADTELLPVKRTEKKYKIFPASS